MFKQEKEKPHVSPKVRAYGKARLDIARRAVTEQDWEMLWKPPQNPFPFKWGKYWKQCIEYQVDDFAAEVGFWIDVIGLTVIAFDQNYAMFTNPAGDFTFAVAQAPEGGYSTPPDAIRIQFMVDDILSTTQELVRRGITLAQNPEPLAEGGTMAVSTFLTPHGICVDVWGEATPQNAEIDERETGEMDESAEEEIDSALTQPVPEKNSDQVDEEIDDLFEEIHETPKPKLSKKAGLMPEADEPEDTEEEFEDEIQYVDEPEGNYPTYKPIPLRK